MLGLLPQSTCFEFPTLNLEIRISKFSVGNSERKLIYGEEKRRPGLPPLCWGTQDQFLSPALPTEVTPAAAFASLFPATHAPLDVPFPRHTLDTS